MSTVLSARVSVAVLFSSCGEADTAAVCASVDDGAATSVDTTTAVLGASAPGSPAGNLAVNGASESVAGLVFLEHGAGDTTVEVGGKDGTAALLGAGATSGSTGTEGGPGRDAAIHGAVESLASLDELGDGASDTTVEVHVDDGAAAALGAGATSGRACSEGSPGSDLAVNGAAEGVAAQRVGQGWAADTTVLDISDDGAGLGLGADTAGLGACTVTSPARELAVNGASEGLAGLVFLEHGAGETAVSVGGKEGTAALLGTSATSGSTGTEGGPGRDLAVNGTMEGVASLDGLGCRASDTTVEGLVDDGAAALLGAGATSGRACSEGSPAGVLAVNGAAEGVAAQRVGQGWAADTTVLDISDDGAGLGLGAGTAGLGACTVTRPARVLAVNGASEAVAGLVFLEHGAGDTAVHVGVEDGTAALLGTSGTSGGTGGEGSPGSEAAIDGASEGVASLDGLGQRASSTAESSSGDDGAAALLGAGGTSGRAGAEGSPAGKLAVDGALEVVAGAVVDVKGTFDTTVLTGRDDGLGALLGTTSTGLGAGRPDRPARKLAVDGATLNVANTLFLVGAFITTVFGSNLNVVGTRLNTSITRLGAR